MLIKIYFALLGSFGPISNLPTSVCNIVGENMTITDTSTCKKYGSK